MKGYVYYGNRNTLTSNFGLILKYLIKFKLEDCQIKFWHYCGMYFHKYMSGQNYKCPFKFMVKGYYIR